MKGPVIGVVILREKVFTFLKLTIIVSPVSYGPDKKISIDYQGRFYEAIP